MLDKKKPLSGFRCWHCGRPLDERNNWERFEEQFYCNYLCREAESAAGLGATRRGGDLHLTMTFVRGLLKPILDHHLRVACSPSREGLFFRLSSLN